MITSGVWQGSAVRGGTAASTDPPFEPELSATGPTLRPRCPNERQVWGGGGGMPYGGNGVGCGMTAFSVFRPEPDRQLTAPSCHCTYR